MNAREREGSEADAGLERAVGKLGGSGVVDRMEALAHMDPVSAAILTGKVVSVVIPADSDGISHEHRVLMAKR